ncbi:TPA: glycosyltransferase family 2 protein [Candidatus Woesearchaeota archaeon]|nr:glycosyltransferase family 2 protein [Candidatus Woesearchaeota archaeon]
MDIVVVIPAYNEEKYIGAVVEEVKKYVPNVIVIDDGSRDRTAEIAKQHKVILIRHSTNLGKGAALRNGCDFAIKKGAKALVVLDADGQHDPSKIPEFLGKLSEFGLVFGYRELSTTMPFILRFGNRFISKSTHILYGISLRDTQSGYRAFTAETYPTIRWESSDYGMESEMIAKAGKHRLKYAEIPIQTIYADKYKGTTVIDGIKIVMKMVWWRLH